MPQERHWTDDPRKSKSEDELERSILGERVANRIREVHTDSQSVVFGLVGPWGSGKTTLINFAIESLEEPEGEDAVWHIARFSPWAAGDEDGVLREFYSALSSAIPGSGRGSKKARAALAGLIEIAAPLGSAVPFAGAAVELGAKELARRMRSRPSWHSAFEQASRHIRALRSPVLVVVDDVDRLQPDELLVLLKVVRLLGRFPGVDYLIAYDHESVAHVLNGALSDGRANDSEFAARFVEKIVQYPFYVPPLSRDQILTRLAQKAKPASQGEGSALRGWEWFESVFASALQTPRAIDRYVEQLSNYQRLLPDGEYDAVDLDLLVLLRSCYPSVFAAVPAARDVLIYGRIAPGDKDEPNANLTDTSLVSELTAGLSARDSRCASQVLHLLFPKARLGEERMSRSGSIPMRMADERYFDRYLVAGILPADLSDRAVGMAVAQARSGAPGALFDLLREPPQKAALAVAKAKSLLDRDPPRPREVLALLRAVSDATAEIGMRSDPRSRLMRNLGPWSSQLLGAVPMDEPPASVWAALEPLMASGQGFHTVDQGVAMRLGRNDFDGSGWVDEVLEKASAAAADYVVEHLVARDAAPSGAYFRQALDLLRRHWNIEEVSKRIDEVIASGNASVEDLAARFISVRGATHDGGGWWISLEDTEQELFGELLRVRKTPWFNMPAEADVDLSDISWANRRRAARGRFGGSDRAPAA